MLKFITRRNDKTTWKEIGMTFVFSITSIIGIILILYFERDYLFKKLNINIKPPKWL